MSNAQKYRRILTDFLVAGIVILFIIFVLPKAIGFFFPFVLGGIIAMIATPLVRFLEKKVKIKTKHGAAIIMVVVLALVITLVYFGSSILIREGIAFVEDLPELLEETQTEIKATMMNLDGIAKYLPDGTKDFLNNLGSSISIFLTNAVSRLDVSTLGAAGSVVRNVADAFLMSIITILSAYFFLADRENILAGAKKFLPESLQEHILLIKNNFVHAIGAYFKAQFKIMLIMMVILFIGFELLDVHYSFFIALLVAVLDFLPLFGTGTVLGPWIIIDLIGGRYLHAVCLVIIYLVCQLGHQLLQPKLVGDGIGLSPLATLIFMFIGYRMKGVAGMILGIPIGMAILSLYRAGAFDRLIAGAKVIFRDIEEYRKWN